MNKILKKIHPYFKWAFYSPVLIQPCNGCLMSLKVKFEVTLPLRQPHLT